MTGILIERLLQEEEALGLGIERNDDDDEE
jgi:hypothetical protein